MPAWDDILAGEMLVFTLVGRAFYAVPDRAWLESLVRDDVFAESPFGGGQPATKAGLAALQSWTRAHRGGIPDAVFQSLQEEYARLFVGPGPVVAPPWESVHFSQERLLFQDQTFQARDWYARFGLEAPNLHREPDDHIGLELHFVAQLARLGLQACQSEDQELQELLEAQRRFLAEHLLRWGPGWCARVEATSKSDLFRGLALLTIGALSEISERLNMDIPVQAGAGDRLPGGGHTGPPPPSCPP